MESTGSSVGIGLANIKYISVTLLKDNGRKRSQEEYDVHFTGKQQMSEQFAADFASANASLKV